MKKFHDVVESSHEDIQGDKVHPHTISNYISFYLLKNKFFMASEVLYDARLLSYRPSDAMNCSKDKFVRGIWRPFLSNELLP